LHDNSLLFSGLVTNDEVSGHCWDCLNGVESFTSPSKAYHKKTQKILFAIALQKNQQLVPCYRFHASFLIGIFFRRCPGEGKRLKILAGQHIGKESVVTGCSELFLLDTHFVYLALQKIADSIRRIYSFVPVQKEFFY
jgi:hypothetical protein